MRPSRTWWIRVGILLAILLAIAGGSKAWQARRAPRYLSEDFLRLPAGESETFPLYAGCAAARAGTIALASHFIVPKAFASQATPESIVRGGLRYASGYFAQEQESLGGSRVFLTPQLHISIDHVEPVRYPVTLDFDYLNDDQSLYPRAFRNDRMVRAGEAAVDIRFHAEQEVVVCGGGPDRFSIKLPLDPPLAFWAVPKTERRPVRYGFAQPVLTNPCADSEMAQLKSPSMYWYVWHPSAAGKDADGHPYDCRTMLVAGRDYTEVPVTFSPSRAAIGAVDFRALEAQPRLDVRVIQGLFSQKSSRATLDRAGRLFARDHDLIETARLFGRRQLPQAELRDQDPSTRLMLEMIFSVSQAAEISRSTVEDRGSHFELGLEGRLRASGKPLSVRIFFGPTDEPQHKAAHWPFLASSLEESPLVIYSGHSGMGKNLDFGILRERLGLSEDALRQKLSRQPYQMLMMISCYANQYFGDDYLTFRDSRGKTTDLLRSAVGVSNPVRIPASLLHYLDLDLVGKRSSLSRALAFDVKAGEMISLERRAVAD